MMIGFYVEVFPKGQMPARPSGGRGGQLDPKQLFTAFDLNKDNKLSKDELPYRLAERFALFDTDADGGVSLEELEKLLKLFAGLRGQRDD